MWNQYVVHRGLVIIEATVYVYNYNDRDEGHLADAMFLLNLAPGHLFIDFFISS